MADPNDPAIIRAAEDLGFVARNLRLAGHDTVAAVIDAVAAALVAGVDIDPAVVADAGPQPSDGPDHHADHAAWEDRQPTAPAAPVAPAPAVGNPGVPQELAGLTPDEIVTELGGNAAVFQLGGDDGHARLLAGPFGFGEPLGAPDPVDEEPFEPVTVTITFDPRPGVTDDVLRAALDMALRPIGTYRYQALDGAEGTAAIEVFAPGQLPLVPGAVAVAGVVNVDGEPTSVCAAIPDEDGNVADIDDAFAAADDVLAQIAATAELFGEAPPQARTAFTVAYHRDGAPLDDETLRPVLDMASRTLSRFGQLVPTSVTHADGCSLVEYSVLEAGGVSTAHLSAGTIGWGGTVEVPGVGRVTASIVS